MVNSKRKGGPGRGSSEVARKASIAIERATTKKVSGTVARALRATEKATEPAERASQQVRGPHRQLGWSHRQIGYPPLGGS